VNPQGETGSARGIRSAAGAERQDVHCVIRFQGFFYSLNTPVTRRKASRCGPPSYRIIGTPW
jgi:hypothetical protein